MIHYHGLPITPVGDMAKIMKGRHAMISFANRDQLPVAMEVCQSFALDNGAFSMWKSGKQPDWDKYHEWVSVVGRHPACDWAIIPDVIDGSEDENDALIEAWPHGQFGVPVWHLHESLERLEKLVSAWTTVAIGSSGQYADVGIGRWWNRMAEAMSVACDGAGYPKARLHGLRMLNPNVYARFPFRSVDSSSIGRKIGLDSNWKGTNLPPHHTARGYVLAERYEALNAPAFWEPIEIQQDLELTA